VYPLRSSATVLLAVAALFAAAPLAKAQNQDWFVPGQQRPAAQGAPRTAPRPAAPRPVGAPQPEPGQGPEQAEEPPQPLQVQLPPAPPLPPLEKGVPPPAAVMGVLDVPQVLRNSTAYQQVEKAIGARRQKLNEDAQAEQTAWRDMQQQFAAQRTTLSAEQIRGREKELQDRITEAQRKFRDRNRIIQDAGQYALAQIDRALNQVVQQVALGRGMNLVMHRAQVALNMPDFDISDQVAAQLNKMLATVIIPPDGVPVAAVAPATPPGGAPAGAAPAGAAPDAAPTAAAQATPPTAAAPAATPAAAPAPSAKKPAPATQHK
jgi:Skp family chaperone for outer membrane proteins